MRFFIRFINFTDAIRDFFTNNVKFKDVHTKIIKVTNNFFYSITVLDALFLLNKDVRIPKFLEYLSMVLFAAYIINKAIGKIAPMLTTLRGFILYGLIFTSIVFLIVAAFNRKVFDLNTLDNFSSDFSIVNSMVIPVLASTVVWSILSCMAETKIAIVGNAVLTGIITLFREILIYVFSFYEKSPEISIRMKETLSPIELELYSKQQLLFFSDAITKVINTIALPFIIPLGVATIVSLLKDYIEEKEIQEKRSEKKVITSPSGELQ